ncbi:MAG: hypothetical protein ACLGIO_03285 [Acidimicrobiia bacterium]
MTSPPGDAQEWSDEEWLAWLAATDPAALGAGAAGDEGGDRPPRRRSSGGQLLGAAMNGLAEAIHGPREEPAIVVDASGDPPGDGPVELGLDEDHPERSVVVIRPWLLRRTGPRRR